MRNINKTKKIRKVSDQELINQFKNEIIVPKWVINDKTNQFFNFFIVGLAKITRKFL